MKTSLGGWPTRRLSKNLIILRWVPIRPDFGRVGLLTFPYHRPTTTDHQSPAQRKNVPARPAGGPHLPDVGKCGAFAKSCIANQPAVSPLSRSDTGRPALAFPFFRFSFLRASVVNPSVSLL